MAKKSVKFLKKHSPYNGGDIAGFDSAYAHRLVKHGVAEYYDPFNEKLKQEAESNDKASEKEKAGEPVKTKPKSPKKKKAK